MYVDSRRRIAASHAVIGAAASLLADAKGLNWPLSIAPFGAVIVALPDIEYGEVSKIYKALSDGVGLDVVIDDRKRPMGWKLMDADMIGYPFVVIMGKGWGKDSTLEVQSKRLGLKEDVRLEDLQDTLRKHAARL